MTTTNSNVEYLRGLVGYRLFDNHIKCPWRTHSYKFIMVMGKKTTNHLTGVVLHFYLIRSTSTLSAYNTADRNPPVDDT